MANDDAPRPDARFHTRRNSFVTYVNGHPADEGLAAGAIGAELWVWAMSVPSGTGPGGKRECHGDRTDKHSSSH